MAIKKSISNEQIVLNSLQNAFQVIDVKTTAELLNVSIKTADPLLNSMVKKGLVNKHQKTNNGKSINVFVLTAQGKKGMDYKLRTATKNTYQESQSTHDMDLHLLCRDLTKWFSTKLKDIHWIQDYKIGGDTKWKKIKTKDGEEKKVPVTKYKKSDLGLQFYKGVLPIEYERTQKTYSNYDRVFKHYSDIHKDKNITPMYIVRKIGIGNNLWKYAKHKRFTDIDVFHWDKETGEFNPIRQPIANPMYPTVMGNRTKHQYPEHPQEIFDDDDNIWDDPFIEIDEDTGEPVSIQFMDVFTNLSEYQYDWAIKIGGRGGADVLESLLDKEIQKDILGHSTNTSLEYLKHKHLEEMNTIIGYNKEFKKMNFGLMAFIFLATIGYSLWIYYL